ncbi:MULTISPECIES: cbb3-type cytochrome oxidase assembly protein CcoS [Neisseria]|uniref:cbb3-type cytochrome oxidase assembly protein CcoS n=1 Tax=Neisseria TaxID=482 RepID=UPI00211D1422|nr:MULTISPECIES: cbb3-type cytochrome oxidase assembly protein CcoS [Neisseria]MCQ9327555.1 cbb3-type cytochrome oxidase assembly protein CcoS [Neisseria dentiae]MDO4227013.1 cbb3-type cytochrome oxidase assembly protein CcoS [Neisseria sp.]MDO4906932.1 cbb3-type cytochrome oxidase assembly protein CcoS [Neisseria sp.]
MESVFILIPISIILAFLIAYFFWWSGKNGQFDDLEGPAHRILMDDDSTDKQAADKPQEKQQNEP